MHQTTGNHPDIGRTTAEEQIAWENELLNALGNCMSPEEQEETAKGFGTTLAEAQALCGGSGHEWTHWEAGDGIWFQSGADFCQVCGIGRDY